MAGGSGAAADDALATERQITDLLDARTKAAMSRRPSTDADANADAEADDAADAHADADDADNADTQEDMIVQLLANSPESKRPRMLGAGTRWVFRGPVRRTLSVSARLIRRAVRKGVMKANVRLFENLQYVLGSEAAGNLVNIQRCGPAQPLKGDADGDSWTQRFVGTVGRVCSRVTFGAFERAFKWSADTVSGGLESLSNNLTVAITEKINGELEQSELFRQYAGHRRLERRGPVERAGAKPPGRLEGAVRRVGLLRPFQWLQRSVSRGVDSWFVPLLALIHSCVRRGVLQVFGRIYQHVLKALGDRLGSFSVLWSSKGRPSWLRLDNLGGAHAQRLIGGILRRGINVIAAKIADLPVLRMRWRLEHETGGLYLCGEQCDARKMWKKPDYDISKYQRKHGTRQRLDREEA